MPSHDDPSPDIDLELLDRGSKALLGYFVHTWFRHYLGAASESLGRLHERGFIETPTRPTELGRHVLFDFGALDEEKLAYILGLYFYVQTCHKAANNRLMKRYDGKQVLYLRGYDVEGSVSIGAGSALGSSTYHTQTFGMKLAEMLGDDVALFKVISPKDVYWDTITAQHFFSDGYGELIRWVVARPSAIYLNARRWQEGVLDLLDRMDHYVVYVSSTTPSLLWELAQLDVDGRRDRVTVVLDAAAMKETRKHLGVQEGLRGLFGEQVIWSKQGPPPEMTEGELTAWVSERFLVITPEELGTSGGLSRAGIAGDSSLLRPGNRETWFDFDFSPALEDEDVARLRAMSADLGRLVDEALDSHVECLPLTVVHLQLRIYATLLFAEHDRTGRTLASYAGLLQAALEYYEPEEPRIAALTPQRREDHLNMLREHLELTQYIGLQLLSSGKTHEFDDYSVEATATFATEYERALDATRAVFTRLGGPLPSP